jgi:mannosyltransferase
VIRSEVGPPNGPNYRKAKHGVYSLLVNLYKRFYSYFTAYNELEARSLELLGFPKERIILLPPMVDFEKFSSLGKNRALDNMLTIGVMARISPEKGVHRVIPMLQEILRRNPNAVRKFKFILAGRIDNENYAQSILTKLRNMLGSSLIYMGEVASPYSFYENVDVVLVPSLIETGAITVLEAMATGKCVIASNIYPINLYINHKVNGCLFNTVSEAAEIILDILEQRLDIKSIGKEAQRYAQKHDYKTVCKRLEEIYYQATQAHV